MDNQIEQFDYDVIIIGGGATGLGTAVEAATRGYKTLLLEGYDYGKGTSSKSTKLIHGGLRYLANMDFSLVKEGLEERYYFLNNAPHLAKKQTYLIPLCNYTEKLKYTIGTRLYDYLSGKLSIGKSVNLNKKNTLNEANDFNEHKLIGSIIYYDGQFDDTRMLMSLYKTFIAHGGNALNYHKVEKISCINQKVHSVSGINSLNQAQFNYSAKYIINATGTFSNQTEALSDKKEHQSVSAAQGTHLVFNKRFFDTNHAILIPETIDGRVLFILPWHDKIVVGTTDIKVAAPTLEPTAQLDEINFILATFNQYSKQTVTTQDILSVFCGQRPLVKESNTKNTAKISRKHLVKANPSNNLINIVGGKWTIYRRMGEDAIDYIENYFKLDKTLSITRNLVLVDGLQNPQNELEERYGNEYHKIQNIQLELNNYDKIHQALPYYQAEIIYQIRYEQAKTVEDVLCRRTRAMFLDAKASYESIELVATIIAREMGNSMAWINQQIEHNRELAKNYMVQFIIK